MGLFSRAVSPDAAAGEELTVTIGGQPRKMSRVRLRHLAAFAERIRDRRIAAIQRNRAMMDPPDYARAVAQVAAIDPTEIEVLDMAMTSEGRKFLLWKALSEHDFTLQERQVEIWMEDEAGIDTYLLQSSGLLRADGEPAGPEENPTTGRAPTGSAPRPVFGASSESDPMRSGS